MPLSPLLFPLAILAFLAASSLVERWLLCGQWSGRGPKD